MSTVTVEQDDTRAGIIAAADELFYRRGIQSVGMDAVRSAANVSLKRLYKEFPGKEDLVVAVLAGRHDMWERGVSAAVDAADGPRAKLLAVYDYLEAWFADSSFRGCGFINAFGELGATSPAIADMARRHKESFQRYIAGLTATIGLDHAHAEELAAQLALLAEGAQTTAAIAGTADAAVHARRAAATLVDAAVATR
ncbi:MULTISPECIES: TetR/AcrR family transcriptional regulator [unclassified Curtobacterium]|uniref:TetR/AcrR family transcriptional regulator n=1 Tax=unclassified Curtobacterium TaxID=257496 RepID=UPI000DA916E0|nr:MULTISPECIES: TetR/AcrR family transcriptional regulator [unclassified Curtobacterium]PZE24002.1 TetR/AcrR family transcriptional regulator [Curtobacterium sp. MCBD17_028]PZE73587.1 TetR/AcrR family transcriptional regulator [Curtobacterium sp. MCBD17_019]PZF56880.1 TetR/AcrR family transcriptional regulator [Curtobacterium sp. MCBD17_034]PZF60601.1 TetR/AcrR family transcriptional regulator [Curtobacterium sp. MCBD17_013]PZM33836.1 TetR/AcrR family transcriptional regulator [Curtobacterium